MAGCEIRSVYASISGNRCGRRNSHPASSRSATVRCSYADLDRVLGSEGRCYSGRPEDPARDPRAGACWTVRGRHPQSGQHDRRASRSACASRGLRNRLRPTSQQVRAALRPAGGRSDLLVAGIEHCSVDQRRRANSAWCWWISAPALPTSRCSCTARSVTPRRCRSLAITSTSAASRMLRTPTPEAEQIKVRYACALAQLATAEKHPGAQRRRPRRVACRAMRWRRRCRGALRGDLRNELQAELRRSGFEELVPPAWY